MPDISEALRQRLLELGWTPPPDEERETPTDRDGSPGDDR